MDERRYYGLDALRGGMMMLGIVLHAAMFYLVQPPTPIPTDPNTSYVFDAAFYFIHSFRMQAFFLIAGFFTALLVAKRGVRATYKDRIYRILVPLIVASVTILPITALFMVNFFLSARFGTHHLIPDLNAMRTLIAELTAKGVAVGEPSLGHLWFLEYLCIFYLLIPLCRRVLKLSLRFEDRIKRWLESPLALLVFSLCTSALLWPFPGGVLVLENTLLVPHVPSLIYFGWFFTLGYLIHHYRDFLAVMARSVAIWAALALLSFVLARYTSLLDLRTGGADETLHLLALLANGFCTWVLIYFFVGGAVRFFDRDTPWIQYISQSAYWVFLVHLPLVALAGWWLVQFDIPAMLKFLLNSGFTTLVAMWTFHYWVQKTWISDFLHGRRFNLQWPWRVAPTLSATNSSK